MKIAWFTPYSSRSAIARYSRLVTTELARRHEVDIWTFCTEDLLSSSVPVHSLTSHEAVPDAALNADLAVYQMGNYWPFHGEIWRQSQNHPGIIVLHDFVMHGFFAALFFEQLRSPEAYRDAMRQWHGNAGAAAAAEFLAGARRPVWEEDDMIRFPMLRGVTPRALGVVGHSRFVVDAAGADYFGPKVVLPLPYEKVGGGAPVYTREDIELRPDQLLLITVGHANPNKRIDDAIRALGTLPEDLKRRVVYAVIGPVDNNYRPALLRLGEDAGIAGGLRIDGYMPKDRMQAYIAHADLCINLRWPNTEGASASLVEQMLAGKPVITNNTGWFAELPAGVTRRVGSPAEFATALQQLLEDAGERLRLAQSAADYADRTFRVDAYAEGLERFLDSVLRLTPLNVFADATAEQMSLMGVGDEWVSSIANRTAELFGGEVGNVF